MRFKLLRGIHEQAKYPQFREMNLGGMSLEDLKSAAEEVDIKLPKNVTRDEVIRTLRTSERFHARDPKRNIVVSDMDLEARHGSEKFQNLDRLMEGGGPGEDALRRRIAELEAENRKLRKAESVQHPAPGIKEGTAETPAETPGPTNDRGEGEEEAEDEYEFNKMTVAQLKDFAKEFEIDLEGATTKKEIVQVLRSEMGTR